MAAPALITGGTGLIGTYVVRHWNVRELKPVILEREADDLLIPGIPTAVIRRIRPAVVIHLAWTASGTPDYRTSSDNDRWVDSSLELRRACQEMGVWLVATGTALDQTTNSPDAYSASKFRLRLALEQAITANEVTWLRPYYVFDPERRRPALVAEALAARDRNAVLNLRTPEAEHDFIHASDVGRAVVFAVENQLRGVVPIGSGTLRRVQDLVSAIGVGWTATRDPLDAAPQVHEAADCRELRAVGWSPNLTEKLFDPR